MSQLFKSEGLLVKHRREMIVLTSVECLLTRAFLKTRRMSVLVKQASDKEAKEKFLTVYFHYERNFSRSGSRVGNLSARQKLNFFFLKIYTFLRVNYQLSCMSVINFKWSLALFIVQTYIVELRHSYLKCRKFNWTIKSI